MKLIEAIDIARYRGLETLKEAFINVDIHAGNIFAVDKIAKELGELADEIILVYVRMDKDLDKDEITFEEYENYIKESIL